MAFDEDTYQLHLSQARKRRGLPQRPPEPLFLAVFKWDPNKHRRGLRGRFIDMPNAPDAVDTGDRAKDLKTNLGNAIKSLGVDEDIELPGGFHVYRNKQGGYTVKDGNGIATFRDGDHDSAAKRVLDNSAMSTDPASLGNKRQFAKYDEAISSDGQKDRPGVDATEPEERSPIYTEASATSALRDDGLEIGRSTAKGRWFTDEIGSRFEVQIDNGNALITHFDDDGNPSEIQSLEEFLRERDSYR